MTEQNDARIDQFIRVPIHTGRATLVGYIFKDHRGLKDVFHICIDFDKLDINSIIQIDDRTYTGLCDIVIKGRQYDGLVLFNQVTYNYKRFVAIFQMMKNRICNDHDLRNIVREFATNTNKIIDRLIKMDVN